MLASSLAILPHYFDKKLSLANGVCTCLCAIIIVVLPIFTSIILDKAGLRQAFQFLALLNLFSAFMCFTYKPLLPRDNHKESISSRIKQIFGLQVFKSKRYLVWVFATAIAVFGYLIPIVNIVRKQFIYS